MAEDAVDLLEEFARSYAAGERPDVGRYLERAGPAAARLAPLLEDVLTSAPAPDPPEELVAQMAAWIEGDTPLLALRTRRGLTREAVVQRLCSALGLAPAQAGKVSRYYHRLEGGDLDTRRVDRRVFARWPTPSAPASRTCWRGPRRSRPRRRCSTAATAFSEPAASVAADMSMAAAAPMRDEEWDEVDRLFAGAPPPPEG